MKHRQALYTAIFVAVLFLLWQLLCAVYGYTVLSPPWATVRNAAALLGSSTYWPHISESMRAFLIALLISYFVGTFGGIVIGGSRAAAAVSEPLLAVANSIPKVTLFPVILLIFGLGMWAKVVFGALHGTIPVMIFSLGAVRNINPVFIRCARMLRLTRWQMIRRIWIPACIPEVFSGLRIGFSLTLLGTVFGEFFASQRGFGFLLMNAINLRDTPTIMALILILAAFAILCNSALLLVDRRLHRRLA